MPGYTEYHEGLAVHSLYLNNENVSLQDMGLTPDPKLRKITVGNAGDNTAYIAINPQVAAAADPTAGIPANLILGPGDSFTFVMSSVGASRLRFSTAARAVTFLNVVQDVEV